MRLDRIQVSTRPVRYRRYHTRTVNFKKARLQTLQWLLRRTKARPSLRRTQKAIQQILLLELAGVRWYSPRLYLSIGGVYVQRLWQTLRREWRGYQQPMAHPNPNVRVCKDLVCINRRTNGCTPEHDTVACLEHCFGMRRTESGNFVSLWQAPDGSPEWLEFGCRNCTLYLTACKGVVPLPALASEPLPEPLP